MTNLKARLSEPNRGRLRHSQMRPMFVASFKPSPLRQNRISKSYPNKQNNLTLPHKSQLFLVKRFISLPHNNKQQLKYIIPGFKRIDTHKNNQDNIHKSI